MMTDGDREQVGSPTATTPTIITQPLKEPDDKDLSKFFTHPSFLVTSCDNVLGTPPS
jgi:hypothetical protein